MKIFKIFPLLLFVAFAFSTCDKVEAPYQTGFDCESGNQNVLIEDYTGHTCVNCPSAAVTAHDIKSNCEERVIVIAVHAGYFAEPLEGTDFDYDFRTPTGNIWNDYFGIVSNPNGLVNRMNNDGNYIIPPGQWAAEATKLLSQNAPVDIEINNEFNATDNKLKTTINANFIDALSGNYNLVVCITEDNIVKAQKNNNSSIGDVPEILDYEHMHVLRKVVSQQWGDQLFDGYVDAFESLSKSYEISFDGTDWNPENCNVVAFITNVSDKSVVQVNESAIVE
ncbi:MAG: hypothetical protein C0598_12725 [Marinilabiliales bacterium]|nr:MAG: hypothetical protein C0598_12725 [Marinilabiliales bacterium]